MNMLAKLSMNWQMKMEREAIIQKDYIEEQTYMHWTFLPKHNSAWEKNSLQLHKLD